MKGAKTPKISVRRAVLRMPQYVAPEEGRAGKLRLDFNENTVGCPPSVLRALSRITVKQLAMYPEYGAASERIARAFGVRPQEMIFSNGIDDALHLITDTFVEQGDAVLLAEPTFDMYRFYSTLADARIVAVRYDDQLRFPLAAILRELRRAPRVLFLANPNNPTGTLVPRAALRQILRASPRTLVLIDEAYFDFCGETVLPWIHRYANLIVARTFSKAAGLAALRIGCLFSRRENLAAMNRARTPFPVNAAALIAAEAALRDKASRKKYVDEVLKSRALLAAGLKRLGVQTFPSAANFILADFGAGAGKMVRALERKGILLRERKDFPREGFVRVTAGTRADTRRLLAAIEALQ